MAASLQNMYNNNNTLPHNSPYGYRMAGNFRGLKRPRDFSKGPPAKRPSLHVGFALSWQSLSRAIESVAVGGKSPVSALNELGVKVTYSLLDYRGPAHCPSFTVAVSVADLTFRGHGASKREARANAARLCLDALLAKATHVLPRGRDIDFSADHQAIKPKKVKEVHIPPPVPAPAPDPQQSTEKENVSEAPLPNPEPPVSESPSLFTPIVLPLSHKSPINVLYENFPGVTFQTMFGDGTPIDNENGNLQINHSMRFKVVCTVRGRCFEGYGSSKKQAKLAASRSALALLMDIRPPPTAPVIRSTLPQHLADHISKLVNEKFNELMRHDPVHSKRKVLAGIVMTVDNRLDKSKIIAVTTGTKCVSGEYMSVSGRAVNDCHAEVAARRCLQRYLYRQLLMYAESEDPRDPIEESDLQPLPIGGYKLKDDRKIHLYISTAPCGDGRIFSPHESKGEPDRHPNRFSRGQLRSKIESGEGTIPVKNSNLIQTWDGVLQGERLLTMSCSDKVARWCVTGLQGALLSQIIKPVYLSSLVLGSLLHTEHMYRAICGRIEGYIQALPPPFSLVAPMLARAASTESRSPARAPSFSVCWCATAPMPEILNAVTGKLENEQPSLLCKQAMFGRWIHLIKKLPSLPQIVESDIKVPAMEKPESLLYAEAKYLSGGYQVAKQCLKAAFEKAQLGKWVKKPIEQDQFLCEVYDANPTVLFA